MYFEDVALLNCPADFDVCGDYEYKVTGPESEDGANFYEIGSNEMPSTSI